MKNELLTLKETAALLRITPPTFLKLRRTGKLPFYKSGRKLLFDELEVLEAIKTIKL